MAAEKREGGLAMSYSYQVKPRLNQVHFDLKCFDVNMYFDVNNLRFDLPCDSMRTNEHILTSEKMG